MSPRAPTPTATAFRPPPASASAFNPAIGVVLDGRFGAFSRNPSGYRIPGFQLGEEASPGQRGFALGEGIWKGLSLDARVQQIGRLIALHDELYPSLRMFFYDGRTHYSVPYTVFGPVRAAVYVGQMYFVFNTKEHIRVLTRHFDDLVRAAVVQANDTPKMLAALRDEVVKAEKR